MASFAILLHSKNATKSRPRFARRNAFMASVSKYGDIR